jgi:hypothetical protein
MTDRFGMAIRPPAFLSEDVAKAVFRPPWVTLHAVARGRGVDPDTVFREIEPDLLALAQGLQAELHASGWPEEDANRRALIQRVIYAQLGPLRNAAGVLQDFSVAARGKPLAWLYGPEAMSVLVRMTGTRRDARVNRVALSLYCQDLDGHEVIASIIRKLDHPDRVTAESGEGDPAAAVRATPLAPVVALPRPTIPFSGSAGSTWSGSGPAPARASAPLTLPEVNRWAEVSLSPPPSVSGDGAGAAADFLQAIAVGAALRS